MKCPISVTNIKDTEKKVAKDDGGKASIRKTVMIIVGIVLALILVILIILIILIVRGKKADKADTLNGSESEP